MKQNKLPGPLGCRKQLREAETAGREPGLALSAGRRSRAFPVARRWLRINSWCLSGSPPPTSQLPQTRAHQSAAGTGAGGKPSLWWVGLRSPSPRGSEILLKSKRTELFLSFRCGINPKMRFSRKCQQAGVYSDLTLRKRLVMPLFPHLRSKWVVSQGKKSMGTDRHWLPTDSLIGSLHKW